MHMLLFGNKRRGVREKHPFCTVRVMRMQLTSQLGGGFLICSWFSCDLPEESMYSEIFHTFGKLA